MASEPQVKKQKLETEETLLEEIDSCQNEVSYWMLLNRLI